MDDDRDDLIETAAKLRAGGSTVETKTGDMLALICDRMPLLLENVGFGDGLALLIRETFIPGQSFVMCLEVFSRGRLVCSVPLQQEEVERMHNVVGGLLDRLREP